MTRGLNVRTLHGAALALEVALIGGFLLSAISAGRYFSALIVAMIPLLWRVLYAAVLTAVSRFMFHTPEATPLFSRSWLSLVAAGGVAIWRNQIGMTFPPPLAALSPKRASAIIALIPGYSCNAGCFGTLPKRLAAHGLECAVFEPVNPFGDLPTIGADAKRWLSALARLSPARPIVLVGISMGGIVARLATADSDAPSVAHLVTISSPHSGTWTARFGVGTAARQMRPKSSVLERLNAQPLSMPATAIWTPDDAIILPPESGKLNGAELIAVPGYTHLAVVEAPAVELVILRAVEAASARSGVARKGPDLAIRPA